MRGAAALAFVVCVYLAWTSLSGGTVAGCGDTGPVNCEGALQSEWAYWFTVPVSIPAALTYLSLLTSLVLISSTDEPTRVIAWTALVLLSVMAAGAAIWFISLQLVWMRSVCLYCLAVHSCGLLIAGFTFGRLMRQTDYRGALLPARQFAVALTTGCLGLTVLLAGQLAATGPGMAISEDEGYEDPGLQIEGDDEPSATSESGPAAIASAPTEEPNSTPQTTTQIPDDVDAQPMERSLVQEAADPTLPDEPGVLPPAEQHRQLPLRGGQSIDAFAFPCDGSPVADHIVVKLFDYTCPHCRTMHMYLRQARERYGDRLAVLLVPVPMNSKCNKYVQTDSPQHAAGCAIARLAFSVWLADPGKFQQYHDWLFEPPVARTADAARAEAVRLVGAAAIDEQHDASVVNDRLYEGTELYNKLGRGLIPKLLYKNHMSSGKPNSADQLFRFIEKTMGLKPTTP
jgi:uncharacterized membrane protein/protein-disulfide isomerase